MKRQFILVASQLLGFGLGVDLVLSQVARGGEGSDVKTYEDCLRTVLAEVKSGKVSKDLAKDRVAECADRHPASFVLTRCKKKIVTKYRGERSKMIAALRECATVAKRTRFHPAKPLPFYNIENQLYFAGLGLNNPLPLDQLSDPDFDCSHVDNFSRGKVPADYILFGNKPAALEGLTWSFIQRRLQAKAKGYRRTKEYIEIAGFGRVYKATKKQTPTVFFPVAACKYKHPGAETYKAINIYYLIDTITKRAIPYFGIAFYRDSVGSKWSFPTLEKLLLEQLGQAYSRQNNREFQTIYAKQPIRQVDQEGDPRDVCAKPRPHQLIATIKTAERGEKRQVDYLVVANVENLCQHGDLLARRLTSQR